MKRFTLVALAIACTGCNARAPAPATNHYRVELDVYVKDSQALCNQAWGIALPDHGPVIAEMVTMTRGEFDPLKCLATVFQKLPAVGVVRAGIYVREVAP